MVSTTIAIQRRRMGEMSVRGERPTVVGARRVAGPVAQTGSVRVITRTASDIPAPVRRDTRAVEALVTAIQGAVMFAVVDLVTLEIAAQTRTVQLLRPAVVEGRPMCAAVRRQPVPPRATNVAPLPMVVEDISTAGPARGSRVAAAAGRTTCAAVRRRPVAPRVMSADLLPMVAAGR